MHIHSPFNLFVSFLKLEQMRFVNPKNSVRLAFASNCSLKRQEKIVMRQLVHISTLSGHARVAPGKQN